MQEVKLASLTLPEFSRKGLFWLNPIAILSIAPMLYWSNCQSPGQLDFSSKSSLATLQQLKVVPLFMHVFPGIIQNNSCLWVNEWRAKLFNDVDWRILFHFSKLPFPHKSWMSEIPGCASCTTFSATGDRSANITPAFSEHYPHLGQLSICKVLLRPSRKGAV